jgi:hypothetical protein
VTSEEGVLADPAAAVATSREGHRRAYALLSGLGRVFINSDCSAIADCRIWRVRIGDGSSGDLLPPSPPAEKATARQDQPGKSGTGDGAGQWGLTTTRGSMRQPFPVAGPAGGVRPTILHPRGRSGIVFLPRFWYST